jgi:hypothetical protein
MVIFMMKFLNLKLKNQKGQALIIVLILLALGGVTIASSLNYSSTILNDNRILRGEMDGVYAADAGINYAIWALENSEEIPTQLAESINGMIVSIDTEDHGTFTMYCGELTYIDELPVHYDWITMNGTAICASGTCNYTLTINWTGPPVIKRKLVELGVTLPSGYFFDEGSPADFETNITSDDPDETGETMGGAQWVKWVWEQGHGPSISGDDTPLIQQFRINGSGEIEGDYGWVAAQSDDIGLVGEITGQRITITSTAEGVSSTQVESDILLVGGTAYIASWRIVR